MNCPECGSTETKKCSLAYEEGTSCGQTGGPGGKTVCFAQTPLAARCAPPEKPAGGALKAAVAAVVITFFAWAGYKAVMALKLSFHWALWSMAGGFFIAVGAARILWYGLMGKSKKARYDDQRAAWERCWVCLKCGEIFAEDPGASS